MTNQTQSSKSGAIISPNETEVHPVEYNIENVVNPWTWKICQDDVSQGSECTAECSHQSQKHATTTKRNAAIKKLSAERYLYLINRIAELQTCQDKKKR